MYIIKIILSRINRHFCQIDMKKDRFNIILIIYYLYNTNMFLHSVSIPISYTIGFYRHKYMNNNDNILLVT